MNTGSQPAKCGATPQCVGIAELQPSRLATRADWKSYGEWTNERGAGFRRRSHEREETGHPPDQVDQGGGSDAKRVWVKPEVVQLPPLTDLTLQSGLPIGGGEAREGRGTVF